MKITKRQLKRIIKEEKQKLLKEMWGNKEALSPLIAFAQAWSGLSGAIQEQMITVINAYIENNPENAYDVNPNALDEAARRLYNHLLGMDGPDAEDVIEALGWAKALFEEGDEEVEADRMAAEEGY